MTALFQPLPQPDAGEATPVPFILASDQDCLIGDGIQQRMPAIPRSWIAGHLPGFFQGLERGPGVLVGALPFDETVPVHLFQPRRVERRREVLDALLQRPAPDGLTPHGGAWRIRAEPTPAEYAAQVAAALSHMEGACPLLRKAVLARSLVLEGERPVDAMGVLRRLLAADPHATGFAVPLPARTEDGAARLLVGATPELLIEKRGQKVRSYPLAGSARRGLSPEADRQAADALMASDKDRREHAAVVEAILDGLTPYCRDLHAPQPRLVSTATLWHLGTLIQGVLKDPDVSSLELAAALHPTPAVCGLPRAPARDVINRLEGFDRGFFAGALGWCDHRGDGRWLVSIRCAELSGAQIRLYAGAGIVPGSHPQAEVAETSAKFLTMLNALPMGQAVADAMGIAP